MSLFKNKEDRIEENIIEELELEPKDGKKHIVLINMNIPFTKLGKIYNPKINSILKKMQYAEYEILDVKFQSFDDVSIKGREVNTLIIYK